MAESSEPGIPAGLVFVSDEEPGIRRRGRKRFRYVLDGGGAKLPKDADLARIRSLAVPPAWTDVWICADPCGHIQATGRDARGRKQYRYHPDYRADRDQAKFDDLIPFGRVLGDLRAHVDEDLGRPGLPRQRVIALVVELLDRTYIRIGNECYACTNGTFGLTTLRDRHVRVEGGSVQLRFKAKGGLPRDVKFSDRRLAPLVKRCQDLPGQVLFQYVEDGEIGAVSSQDVNAYLRERSGMDVTAKTYRTWGGSVIAAASLAELPPPESVRESQVAVKAVMERVGKQLGNTPTVAHAPAYVHPAIINAYQDGTLPETWAAGPAQPARRLGAEERRMLHVLRRGRRRRKPKTAAA